MTALRILLVLAVAGTAVVSPAAASPPAPRPYLVLRETPAPSRRPRRHQAPVAPQLEIPAQAYAYGWFGARPRRHHAKHFGYYRNYTEWSAQ